MGAYLGGLLGGLKNLLNCHPVLLTIVDQVDYSTLRSWSISIFWSIDFYIMIGRWSSRIQQWKWLMCKRNPPATAATREASPLCTCNVYHISLNPTEMTVEQTSYYDSELNSD